MIELVWFLLWFQPLWLGQHTERPVDGEPAQPVKPGRPLPPQPKLLLGRYPVGFK